MEIPFFNSIHSNIKRSIRLVLSRNINFDEYLEIPSFFLYCKGCKINNAENLFFTSFLNDLFLNDVIPLPPSQQQIRIPSQLSTHSSISEELTLSKFACTATKIFLETQIIFSNIKQKIE